MLWQVVREGKGEVVAPLTEGGEDPEARRGTFTDLALCLAGGLADAKLSTLFKAASSGMGVSLQMFLVCFGKGLLELVARLALSWVGKVLIRSLYDVATALCISCKSLAGYFLLTKRVYRGLYDSLSTCCVSGKGFRRPEEVIQGFGVPL